VNFPQKVKTKAPRPFFLTVLYNTYRRCFNNKNSLADVLVLVLLVLLVLVLVVQVTAAGRRYAGAVILAACFSWR
jgi:hypothetical protein